MFVLIHNYSYEGYDEPLACFEKFPTENELYRVFKEMKPYLEMKLKDCKAIVDSNKSDEPLDYRKDHWAILDVPRIEP